MKYILQLFQPFFYHKLFFAICGSWVIFLSAPDLWKLSYDFPVYWIILFTIFIGSLVIADVYRKLTFLDTALDSKIKIKRAVSFFFLAIIYSLLIGLACSILISRYIVDRNEKGYEILMDEESYNDIFGVSIEYPDTIYNLDNSAPLFSSFEKNDSIWLGIYRYEYENDNHNKINLLLCIDTVRTIETSSKAAISNNYIHIAAFDKLFLTKISELHLGYIHRNNYLEYMDNKRYIFRIGNVIILFRSLWLFTILAVFIGIFVQTTNNVNESPV